jgi:glycosyltransferase involved in cell wall biosynthesis
MLEKGLNDKTEKDISIVIPLFDEESNIEKLYTQLKVVLKDLDKEYELIFIDDGSTDNSFSILEGFHNKDKTVKVVQFRRNFGKSAALSAGFKCAKGKIIITMDADLQDDPREIPFQRLFPRNYSIISPHS